MEIRALTQPEQKYTYAQSMQLEGQTGCIGHLRGDFAPYALTLQKTKKLLSGMFSFFNKSYLHQFQNVKAHRLYIR